MCSRALKDNSFIGWSRWPISPRFLSWSTVKLCLYTRRKIVVQVTHCAVKASTSTIFLLFYIGFTKVFPSKNFQSCRIIQESKFQTMTVWFNTVFTEFTAQFLILGLSKYLWVSEQECAACWLYSPGNPIGVWKLTVSTFSASHLKPSLSLFWLYHPPESPKQNTLCHPCPAFSSVVLWWAFLKLISLSQTSS